MKKRVDKKCVFLISHNGLGLCALQGEKPYLCQMWPFRVLNSPTYGREDRARYEGKDWAVYIYADPRCPAIVYGECTPSFRNDVLKEFVQLAIGKSISQNYSTARVSVSRQNS